jgi:hypothetical protein
MNLVLLRKTSHRSRLFEGLSINLRSSGRMTGMADNPTDTFQKPPAIEA